MNLFEAIFDNNPSSPAIRYANSEISYGELRTETLNLARKLAFLRTSPGERVALLLNDSPEFIEAFIAIVSMGAIAVPINMALTLEDQCSILHNSGARLALVEDDFCNKLLTADPERLQFLTDILSVDRKDELVTSRPDHFSITKRRFRTPALTVHSFSDSGSGPQPAFRTPVSDEPSFILYTSGSTGDPKGAVHRQSDIFYTNEGFCRQVLKLTSDDRLFSSSRLPFAYGLGNALTFPLINGATTILCREKPTPEVIASVFTRNRPTIFFAVPVVYSLLLEHYRRTGQLDCSSLRMCVSAGEALPAQLGREWQKVFGVELLDGIGSTELLHMFMSNRETSVRYGSSGQLIDGYEARLIDDQGQPVADNTEGHLWIKGESAAIGYWEKPAETDRTFVDGWVRTGDLYRRTHDGYWFHMGRSDDCFKSSGQWVSPVEVEGVLLSHIEVARAAVVADFDENQLPCACAFVVRHDVKFESARLEKELRELTAASLPRFKQPRNYRFVSELPYTATGKIQRFRLRDELRKGRTE
jgi:benzoate-CoA ligase